MNFRTNQGDRQQIVPELPASQRGIKNMKSRLPTGLLITFNPLRLSTAWKILVNNFSSNQTQVLADTHILNDCQQLSIAEGFLPGRNYGVQLFQDLDLDITWLFRGLCNSCKWSMAQRIIVSVCLDHGYWIWVISHLVKSNSTVRDIGCRRQKLNELAHHPVGGQDNARCIVTPTEVATT